nr:proprotein convertase subtilisin/kexin type 4-like [Anolis sagrei ordinatus]
MRGAAGLLGMLGLLGLLLGGGRGQGRVYVNHWAVRVPEGSLQAQRLARKHALLFLGQVIEGEPYFHLKHRGLAQKSLRRHRGWNLRLEKDPKILWFEQQTLKRRVRRAVPSDPWFPKQWYMNHELHPDLEVLSAWRQGYTGSGVVVSILDDGLEKDHPDLAPNYDPLASHDFNDNDPDPQPRYNPWDENRHGTRCAGEVAAAANNDICGAGVAYRAKIGGVRMLDGPVTDVVEAQSLSLHPQHIHIYSASWGPEDDGRTVDGPGFLATKAFLKGVLSGRGGLGSLFVWASGNGGLRRDDCNCDGYTNSLYTLSVGSTSEGGRVPWYSEACASTLTTTYSSGAKGERQIGGRRRVFRMLHFCKSVSHYYGYGLLDAGALVALATTWNATRPQRQCAVKMLQQPIRLAGPGLRVSRNMTGSCLGESRWIRSLEHVQVQLSLRYSRRGDLAISLSSPRGTRSVLVDVRPSDTSRQGYRDWSFMSTHHWDEDPRGTWTLLLENKGDADNTGFLDGATLKLYGTEEDMMARNSPAALKGGCWKPGPSGTCRGCAAPADCPLPSSSSSSSVQLGPKERPPRGPVRILLPLLAALLALGALLFLLFRRRQRKWGPPHAPQPGPPHSTHSPPLLPP